MSLAAFANLIHPGDRERVLALLAEAHSPPADGSAERVFRCRHRLIRPDGSLMWMRLQGRSYFVPEGDALRLGHATGVALDVTDLGSADQAARANEERHRLVTEAFHGMTYDWDIRGGACERSDGLGALLGYLPHEHERTAAWWASRMHPEDLAGAESRFRDAVASGAVSIESRYRMRRRDGGWVWVHDRARIMRDAAGAPVRLVGATVDVSAEVERESRIRSLEAERAAALRTLDAFIRSAPVGIAYFDREMRYRFINDRLADINGIPAPEHVGRTIAELLPSIAPVIAPAFERAFRGERTDNLIIEGETPADPGVTRAWAEWWFPVPDADGGVDGVGVVVDEITEQREAEAALRQSEERFRTLALAMPQILWQTDAEGVVTYVSDQWRAYTGYDPVIASEGNRTLIHPDDREGCLDEWRRCVALGKRYECEMRLRRFDGEHRWFLARAEPLRSASGAVIAWIGTSTDIHDRKSAEEVLARDNETLERIVRERTADLERSHQQLRLAERMALLGTLSAGLGHDMGNLLVPIRARLASILHGQTSEQTRADADAIGTAVEYLQRLSNGLRLLALDPERAGADRTEARSWWLDAEPMLRNALPRGIHLEGEAPPTETWIAISRAGLTQTVFNLVQNAGDAMKPRGHGLIRISILPVGGVARLRVEDNGPGMPPSVRDRCFDAFFTTKPRDLSTGLGLSLVYGHVRRAGGSLAIESELGRGATFMIDLPLCESPKAGADGEARSALVVVRDARMRAFVSSEVAAMGYAVRDDAGAASSASLWVVDRLPAAPSGATRAVLLGEEPENKNDPRVRALGERPTFSEVRDALRAAHSSPRRP